MCFRAENCASGARRGGTRSTQSSPVLAEGGIELTARSMAMRLLAATLQLLVPINTDLSLVRSTRTNPDGSPQNNDSWPRGCFSPCLKVLSLFCLCRLVSSMIEVSTTIKVCCVSLDGTPLPAWINAELSGHHSRHLLPAGVNPLTQPRVTIRHQMSAGVLP